MKAKPKRLDGEVIWCDRGWQPVNFGFCPSKAAWTKALKKLGAPKDPYPTSEACTYDIQSKGKTTVLVTLGATVEERYSRSEIAGLLCHEAVHVWQTIRTVMGEDDPSIEFEAYSVQAVFVQLYQAWLNTRAPDGMLAVCAQRKKVGG